VSSLLPENLKTKRDELMITGQTGMAETYQAGVHNLGPKERGMRILLGVLGLIFAGTLLFYLASVNAARWWRLVLFIPLFASAMGFFQAHTKFCVAYAARGVYNMDAGNIAVASEADKRKDKARAVKLTLQALTASVVITLLTLLA
jgi:hypothetical protein